jgi:hypothetical protein
MNSVRYELVIGRKAAEGLLDKLITGHCFLNEGDEFYTVKLMMFPGQTYYLVKNRNSSDRYTVFAKIFRDAGRIRFQNPVGAGKLVSDLPTHMELNFPVIQSQMFMSLYPSVK